MGARLAGELLDETAHVGRGPGLFGMHAQALRLEAPRGLRRIQRRHALLQPLSLLLAPVSSTGTSNRSESAKQ